MAKYFPIKALRKLPCLVAKACQSIRKLVLLLENPFIQSIYIHFLFNL